MCYSAEASFYASGFLAIIGSVAKLKNKIQKFDYLAFFPLFFAIQQFSEGTLWTCVNDKNTQSCANVFIQIFVFFGVVFWPIFIPLAVYRIEEQTRRKMILKMMIWVGLVLGTVMTILNFRHGVGVRVHHHLQYTFNYSPTLTQAYGLAYLLPCVFSFFVSSKKELWVLGTLFLVSFVYSKMFYQGHVFSIWCFLSALISVYILKIVIKVNRSAN